MDLVYLVYVETALRVKKQKLDYEGLTAAFTYQQLKNSKYYDLLMLAHDKGYFEGLPKRLGFFKKTFEEELGIAPEDYELPVHILSPWEYMTNEFNYTHMHPDGLDMKVPERIDDVHVYQLLDKKYGADFVIVDNYETAVLTIIAQYVSNFIMEGTIKKLVYFVIPTALTVMRYPIPLLSYLYFEVPFVQQFVNLTFASDEVNEVQLGYLVWEAVGLDLGLITYHKNHTKVKYAKENYQVGDVVLLYQREVSDEARAVRNSLKGCRIGVIRTLNNNSIAIEVINTRNTKYTTQVQFSEYSDEVKELYRFDYNLGVNKHIEMYEWRGMGVDFYISNDEYFEEYFITHLGKDGKVDQYVEIEGKPVKAQMTYYDVVYTILNDYNIKFNKERYKERYGVGN